MDLEDRWADARQKATENAIVIRHINRVSGLECFIEVPRTAANEKAGIDIYDGATVTYPAPSIDPHPDHAGAPA